MKNIISVNNISKQYHLGSELIANQSFREMLLSSLTAPFKKIKKLKGSSKEQESFWALKNVSFDVKPGEVVGVIGRNGAGKSTLLKTLSRITTPTEGDISYRGKLASLLEVGTGFHPELTGRENIYLNGAILGMNKRDINKRLDDIVAFAEIEKFLDTPVKRYSSGMYVRLAFSVAAHIDPDILVIDEVLAVGDQAFQQKCLGKLQETSHAGRTVFFVSHNMAAVKKLCTRIIYLKDGQIEFDGAPDKAIERYLSAQKSATTYWQDKQNANQYLKEITIQNQAGKSSNVFQFDESIDVLMTLEKMSSKRHVAAIRVTDIFGNVLFTSWDQDTLEGKSEINERRLKCTLPKKLFRPASYTLTAFVLAPTIKGNLYVEEQNFDITISAENCDIKEGRQGLIFPVLEWQDM